MRCCPCWTALPAIALLAATAGCGRPSSSHEGRGVPKRPVIGISLMNLSSEFIVMIDKAMEQRANELGATLIVCDAQRSPERQIQQVESFIAQRVDAILLNPCEVEASSPAVDKALAAGIPVVNVNSETKTAPTAFVGSRDEQSARLAMEYIAQRLGGKGNLVMMHGYMGQAAQLKRDAGAREVLAKNPGLHLLAEQTAEWDRAKAVALMENWLQAHGDRIAAVFAQNDEMAMGALLALEQARKKQNVIVVGVDAIADALEAVKQSRLDATVFQDAEGQGRQAVETALKIIRHQPFQKETYIAFRLVTKANVGQYAK
jgi:inositol transport system substrate-binding protein